MAESLQNYVQICNKLDREPDSAEFMAWSFLGIAPDWYNKAIKESN